MNDRKVTQFGTEMISHGNRFIREREVIEFHFSKHGELFALCDDDTLWLYDEEGDEWKRITNVPGTEWVAAETSAPQCGPKAADDGSVWRSLDRGATWRRVEGVTGASE
jgi:photosystem II stability/assembly factor-like uncharacterized protein